MNSVRQARGSRSPPISPRLWQPSENGCCLLSRCGRITRSRFLEHRGTEPRNYMNDTIQAFLAAILDQPEDMNVRLVFSDWLEEHSQPERAELIRVQCELTTMPRWHPGRLALSLRERTLLDRFAVQWRSELPHIGGVQWGQFKCGFVASIRVGHFDRLQIGR